MIRAARMSSKGKKVFGQTLSLVLRRSKRDIWFYEKSSGGICAEIVLKSFLQAPCVNGRYTFLVRVSAKDGLINPSSA